MNALWLRVKNLPILQQTWFKFLMYLGKNFLADNCTQKSASLTYTSLLSIVPMLTLVVVILSSVPQFADAKESIQQMIYSNLLPSTSFQVSQYIHEFATKSSNLTIIGLVALFITTVMTLITIESTFNEIWKVEKKNTTVVSLLRYYAIITLAPLLLGTAFIVSSTVQSLSFLNQRIAGYAINWAVWVQIGSIAIMTFGFVLMYWFIPRCQVKFKYALIAGITTGIIFELLKQTFGFVVQNFTSYEKVYGAFAVLPIFLLWVYLSWNVVLLGVQISYCLTIFNSKEIAPRHPLFGIMEMLNLLYHEYKKGNAVSEIALQKVLGRHEIPHWYSYIRFLEDNNLISMAENNEYILKRSLNNYTFWDFYQKLPYPLPHAQDLINVKSEFSWASEWIDKLINSEKRLQDQFDISMADVFDNVTHKNSNHLQNMDEISDKTVPNPPQTTTTKIDNTGVSGKFFSIKQTLDNQIITKISKIPMFKKLTNFAQNKQTQSTAVITDADKPTQNSDINHD